MIKNIIITIAVLFAMLLILIFFIIFIWKILHLSKKYGEKLAAVNLAKTIPDAFVLKSSTSSFVMAIINFSFFVVAFLLFRFILSHGASFTPSVKFFMAITFFGIIILYELLGTVFAIAGFAARRLEINGQQLKYRNWFGHSVSFHSSNLISCRTFWIGFICGDFLRFVDNNGKKRFACMYLSNYSRTLLMKYLNNKDNTNLQNN